MRGLYVKLLLIALGFALILTIPGLGVDDDFLRMKGAGLRFSGLRVVRLVLSRLGGTNVVKVLSAASGEAREDGLYLVDCDIITSNATCRVESAILKRKPHLRLEWPGGSVDMQ